MREIGSEFWDVPVSDKVGQLEFPDNSRFFLSGRAALSHIIEDILAHRKFERVILPSYCCETMIEPFVSHGIAVEFYPVELTPEGRLEQKIPPHHGCDGILLMDYFGYQSTVPQCDCSVDGIVIRDTTHSVLTEMDNADAHYICGSMRKWAGFWTGGYAWRVNGNFALPKPHGMDREYVRLRKQAMEEKETYMKGCSGDPKKGFLSLFAKASEMMTSKSDLCAAKRDVELLHQFDVQGIKKQRRENAEILLKYVAKYALFPQLGEHDCPLFVPIVLPHEVRDRLRKHLIEKQIYCPIHWPVSSKHHLTQETERIYREELSLVCDQRYNQTDMERMGQAITDFLQAEGL